MLHVLQVRSRFGARGAGRFPGSIPVSADKVWRRGQAHVWGSCLSNNCTPCHLTGSYIYTPAIPSIYKNLSLTAAEPP